MEIEVDRNDSVNVEIASLFRTSILCGPSSVNLGWNGFVLERHAVGDGDRPEKHISHHLIVLSDIRPYHFERGDFKGRFIPHSRRAGSVTLLPAGVIPAVRGLANAEMIVGAISPSLLTSIEEELDMAPGSALSERLGLSDSALRMLITLLLAESEAGGAFGRLYADSLVYALGTRFVQLGRAIQPPNKSFKAGLPASVLRRVLERMNADFSTDLSLATLAAESRCSRNHFIRGFRDATSQTPHRYLLNLRLDKAVQMIKDRSTPLIEIALACGFSSHPHFTKAFRSKFHISPSRYRDTL